jgi:MFS transporter, MHS family, shikimate and dehydroshikimate transport protein
MTSVNSHPRQRLPNFETSRVAAASTIGSVIEWYDYNLFAQASALVFPALFFPTFSPTAGTLASFATFAVAFVTRPIGALIFGHLGDRLGRKKTLILTLLMMGISTIAIGLLPTYEQVGLLAPVLLVVLRVVQGIALGGEWGGAALMAVEHSGRSRRGLFGAWPQVGSPAGNLTAAGMMTLAIAISNSGFVSWGWRIPFIASAILVLVGLFIRLKVSESPVFEEMKRTGAIAKNPIADVFRHDKKRVLLATGSRVGVDVAYYTFAVYSLSYLAGHLGLPRNVGLIALFVGAAVEFVTIPLFGILSDAIGRRPVLAGGLGVLALWGLAFFPLLNTGSQWLIILSFGVALGVGHGMAWSVMGSFFPELFGTRVRCTGASFSFQLAGVIGGAPAPFIATMLTASRWGTAGIGVYLVVACALSLACALALPETYKGNIGESDQQATV